MTIPDMNQISFIRSHSLRRLFWYAYCYSLLEYFPKKLSILTPLTTHIRVPTKIEIFSLIARVPSVYPIFFINSSGTNDESSKKFSIHHFFTDTLWDNRSLPYFRRWQWQATIIWSSFCLFVYFYFFLSHLSPTKYKSN